MAIGVWVYDLLRTCGKGFIGKELMMGFSQRFDLDFFYFGGLISA
jgi:hypothetical protein